MEVERDIRRSQQKRDALKGAVHAARDRASAPAALEAVAEPLGGGARPADVEAGAKPEVRRSERVPGSVRDAVRAARASAKVSVESPTPESAPASAPASAAAESPPVQVESAGPVEAPPAREEVREAP